MILGGRSSLKPKFGGRDGQWQLRYGYHAVAYRDHGRNSSPVRLLSFALTARRLSCKVRGRTTISNQGPVDIARSTTADRRITSTSARRPFTSILAGRIDQRRALHFSCSTRDARRRPALRYIPRRAAGLSYRRAGRGRNRGILRKTSRSSHLRCRTVDEDHDASTGSWSSRQSQRQAGLTGCVSLDLDVVDEELTCVQASTSFELTSPPLSTHIGICYLMTSKSMLAGSPRS